MSAIERVLATGDVRAVLQPIVDLDTGAVVTYEALARGPVGELERPDLLFAWCARPRPCSGGSRHRLPRRLDESPCLRRRASGASPIR
ncbi:MAG: hypothetical protein KY451_13180 [Actinobacteria bacterium]|nr:hypothetical protein [Actinomycetota bacterium]MBW3648275.1 hypothetical protein [Actinomycetota bacterium]